MDSSDRYNRSGEHRPGDGGYGNYATRRSEGAVRDMATQLNTRTGVREAPGESYYNRESSYAPQTPRASMPTPTPFGARVAYAPRPRPFSQPSLFSLLNMLQRMFFARGFNRPSGGEGGYGSSNSWGR